VLILFRSVQAVLFSLIIAHPAVAATPPGWDHPGYDAEDSYYNPAESKINAGTINAVRKQWSVPLRQKSDGSCSGPSAPLVAGGRVIATDQRGISAYRTSDGNALWRFDWPEPEDTGTPAMSVSGDVLIAGGTSCQSMSDPDGHLTALDLATGRVRWKLRSDMPIDSLVVDRGVVAISGESPSDVQATVAYRATDGLELWHRPESASSAVSANGRLLVVQGRSTAAIDITTGRTSWSKAQTWYARSATPVADRFLVVSGTELASVNATTGAVMWTAAGKAGTLIATDGRRVYRSTGRAVEAMDAATGREQWTRQLRTEPTQPVRAGGLLYVGGPVLNAATGVVVSPGTLFAGAQIVTDGHVYTVNNFVLTGFTA
jgi:outer membrane protein assembly factor BamB